MENLFLRAVYWPSFFWFYFHCMKVSSVVIGAIKRHFSCSTFRLFCLQNSSTASSKLQGWNQTFLIFSSTTWGRICKVSFGLTIKITTSGAVFSSVREEKHLTPAIIWYFGLIGMTSKPPSFRRVKSLNARDSGFSEAPIKARVGINSKKKRVKIWQNTMGGYNEDRGFSYYFLSHDSTLFL